MDSQWRQIERQYNGGSAGVTDIFIDQQTIVIAYQTMKEGATQGITAWFVGLRRLLYFDREHIDMMIFVHLGTLLTDPLQTRMCRWRTPSWFWTAMNFSSKLQTADKLRTRVTRG